MFIKAARKTGKTKPAYILDAENEKLGLTKTREQTIRELAGWLTHEEAEELREAVRVFDEIHEEDPSLFAEKMEKNSH